MKFIGKIYRKWYCVCLLLLLTGCSGKPEITVNGFQMDTEEETQQFFAETDLWKNQETETQDQTEGTGWSSEAEREIQVFVCGAVEKPGVYCLKEAARVYEAVEAAGGFRQDADQEWLNQAEVLQDGQKLRIYTLGETQQMRMEGIREQELSYENQTAVSGELSEETDKVNLNTATREQLMTLPGIGEAKAEAVIAYREAQGGFNAIEDIMNISGIKEAVFLKIKDKIMV